MKTIDEALAQMLPAFTPRGAVRVGLHDALGLVLAERLDARFDSPPFDNSAMDGYAVHASALASANGEQPVVLPLVGESRAGGPPPTALTPGACMRIFTGAPMPAGAHTVVMQEDTARDGDVVSFRVAPEPGAHVRRQGSDVAKGAMLLAGSTVLGPGELGLLASQGFAAVSVHRRPRVAILSTGDELRDVSDPDRPGTIVNSNAYALAAQVREAGGDPWILPNVADVREVIAARVREALCADVLVSCGGVSVGEYDFVNGALADAGVVPSFWKVAMKPGKPLSFGVAPNGVPVVGLPGNPVSAMVTFEVFVRPGLRNMLGDPAPFRPTAAVTLAKEHRRSPGRLELARATLRADGEHLVAELHARQGSGSLSSIVGVDAYVLLPADRDHFEAGERITALVIAPGRGTARSPFT